MYFDLFQCAESALKSVLGGLDNTYFVGNAPMAHMAVEQMDSSVSPFKVPNRNFVQYILVLCHGLLITS
jgi:hypothetical protein